MSSTFITNIKLLVNTREQNQLLRGEELSQLLCIENAFLVIEDDDIAHYGRMQDLSTVNSPFLPHLPSVSYS